MTERNIISLNQYDKLVSQISETYVEGKRKTVMTVSRQVTETYWKVGKQIVEFEQNGKQRAKYGSSLMERLSKDLSLLHGKGFSLSNIKRMRQLYLTYPIGAELPRQLSWSHLVELLKIKDPLERSFYQKQSILENWSTTELIRQKKASLFLRLAASKNKDEILQLARKGQIIEKTGRHNQRTLHLGISSNTQILLFKRIGIGRTYNRNFRNFFARNGKRICFYRTTI